MNIITIDAETYWSVTHSLTKMAPIEYVNHPDTEMISMAMKINDGPTEVVFGHDDIANMFSKVDWSDAMVVGHNVSGFDAMLLAWRFGINPKLWACTLAMARAKHAKTCGVSLAKLSEHYKLGVKDSTALINTKGKHLADFTTEELDAMREYNKEDVELCYKLFKKLVRDTTPRELKILDKTIRMLTEPSFELDNKMLDKALIEEQERKKLMLLDIASLIGVYEAGMTDDETAAAASKALGSSVKFGEILKACNVEVPMKPSPSNPDKQTPALAKTDEAFIALQEHDDPLVAMAAQARLGVKSTILESRIKRFQASCVNGKLPVFLDYYGADTSGRWGGGGKLNQQNLPRIDPDKHKPTDALRNSLQAPKGYKVVVADLSGIELRVNHFLWKVPSSMALYNADPEKADLYKEFASKLYEIPVSEVTKAQRQVGKVAHLGLGFGAGANTFQSVAKSMGGVTLTLEESLDVVDKWRRAYIEIAKGWKTCHAALPSIYAGEEYSIDPWGMCTVVEGGIKTPQGMIRYPGLHQETNEQTGKSEWMYGYGRHKSRIYAGKIDENIVQHLAREVMADNMLEISKRYKIVHSVHDEIILVVPESEAVEALDFMQNIMRTPPKWWPELVVWSEGDIADTYGAAK
jgi:DNA polymerase